MSDSRRKWEGVIERLNGTKSGRIRVAMGSPGSAQVTRCRLLAEYRGLYAWTDGATLHLSLSPKESNAA